MKEQRYLTEVLRNTTVADFEQAARRIRDDIIHFPLLVHSKGLRTIRLKLECLQPLGSFKIRGATNAFLAMDKALLENGVATASAGNFAQGLGFAAQHYGVDLTVHVPDSAAQVKLDAIRRLGAKIVTHTFAEWWSIMSTRVTGADDGVFIHPVCEPAVIIGNGTIGLELADDWPEMDTVVIPFGGGGLATGIALALRALSRKVRVVACEIETATPLAAAFGARAPTRVERHPSFVDGIGSNSVLTEMWPLVQELIDDVVVVSLSEARAAVRELALDHHLIVEGAGATALAAAKSLRCRDARVAAVISGGNIDPAALFQILTTFEDSNT